MRGDLVRSVLYLPASNARAVEKARTLDCDVAILDLEDAVAPEAKVEAREAAVAAVKAGGFGPRLGVRINALDTDWGEDDLDALAEVGAGLIVAPKVETVETVQAISGRAPGAALWAMIETPRGLIALNDIAAAGGRLDGLMLGVNDLAKALGTGASSDREPFKPWLAALVVAARAHGLLAIDGGFNRIEGRTGGRGGAGTAVRVRRQEPDPSVADRLRQRRLLAVGGRGGPGPRRGRSLCSAGGRGPWRDPGRGRHGRTSAPGPGRSLAGATRRGDEPPVRRRSGVSYCARTL